MTRKTTKRERAAKPAAATETMSAASGLASAPSGAPANSRQRSVLIAMGICLALMFFTSFLFRMQTPGLQVERPSARKSSSMPPGGMPPGMPAGMPGGMPPGMGGAQGAGGPTAAGSMPGGMPQMGQAPGQMSEEAMGAIGELMKKMSENPNDPKLLFELGERFMSTNSFEKAAVFFTRALVAEPSNVEVLDNLGMCMYELGRYPQAFGYFSQIIALEKDNAQAYLNLGVLKKLMGAPDEAQQFFQTVLDLPNASESFKTKAKKQIEELKTQSAAPAPNKAPESKPAKP
jgi:hypothetical protein